jgi:vancomycin resistance protein VanJ
VTRSAGWFARAVVLAVAVPAALLSAAYLSRPLGSWWLELLQYVPYPGYLGAALIALFVSRRLGWPWRVMAVSALALVLTVIMGLVVGRADRGTVPLRLMTYNVKSQRVDVWPGIFEKLAREVAEQRPDVLVMQDAGDLAWARVDAPAVAELTASIFAGREVYSHGQYIVVSRYPLRDCAPGDLSYRMHPASYVRCTLVVDGREIDLFTAHFLSPRVGLNATRFEGAEGIDDWQRNFEDRLAQSRKLAADVAKRTRPAIVAGDLNAPETSPVIRTLLDQQLRDAFSSAGFGYGYTHGHSLKLRIPFLRIDHVLVSPEIGVVDARPGGTEASEHRPVIADLLLQREAR